MSSKIGIGTWSLQQLSFLYDTKLPEILRIVADMGVDGVDIFDEYMPCHPNTDLHELYNIRKIADSLNLPIKGTWFCSDLIAGALASSVERVIELLKRYLAMTSTLGAKYMAVPFLLNAPGLTPQKGYDILINIFEKILPFAEEYDVRIAHETPRENTPELALDLKKHLRTDYYTICLDLEAWRLDTPDIPLQHAENPDAPKPKPESIETFAKGLPYAPYIHFKLLLLDENGEEPHFPIPEIMKLINESDIEHHLCLEYEGWIPDLNPKLDVIKETKRCVELIRRYQR